jgi:hypothetical protein
LLTDIFGSGLFLRQINPGKLMGSAQCRMIGNSVENSCLLFGVAGVDDLVDGWLDTLKLGYLSFRRHS